MPRLYIKQLGSRSYANYSKDALQECMEAVRSGMPKTTASKTFGIPLRTLSKKIIGIYTKKAGGQTVLLLEEEQAFVNHLLKLAEFGFPITNDDLRHVVGNYLNKKGRRVKKCKNNIPGNDWVRLFLKRHSVLSKRFSANIKVSRVNVSRQDIIEYINNLKGTVEGVPASNIWNFDETNLSDDPKAKKVLVKRGVKYPERICNFSKCTFSVMFCVNAAGGSVPPYVVYKAEHLWSSWFEGGPPGCRYNRTKHGWFDSSTFEDWFTSHMLPVLKKQEGQKVLIGDNLSSHFNEIVIELCEANNIRFVCLPPNTTHLTQPLDVSVFSSLKNEWRKVSHWRDTSEGMHYHTLPNEVFAHLLSQLMEQMKPKFKEIVPSGFRKCSIFPIDCNEILKRLPSDHCNSISSGDTMLSVGVSEAFHEYIQNKRGELFKKSRTQRKKLNVPPSKSICPNGFVCSSSSSQDVENDLLNIVESGNFSFNISIQSEEEVVEADEVSNGDSVCQPSVTRKSDYSVGDYVIVKYNEGLFPGQVLNVSVEGLIVKCMEKGKKAWKWPSKEDKLLYNRCDVLKKINVQETRRGFYYIHEIGSFGC